MADNNNYLKVLQYLKQYEGDGKLHNIEEVLSGVEKQHRNQVFHDLHLEGYIHLEGGHDNSSAFVAYAYGDGRVKSFGPEKVHYFPYEAKITFPGARYLKEELELWEKGTYNINIQNSTISNSNLASPNASIAITKDILKKIDDLIDDLKKTENISLQYKEDSLNKFKVLEEEVKKGEISKETWGKIIDIGAKVSSIGSGVTVSRKVCK